MEKNINKLAVIEKIEDNIKDGEYDYLVNTVDAEFCDVKIVEKEDDIDLEREGWTLWVVKHPEKETKELIGGDCLFLENINNIFGNDHHILTYDEITNFCIFFICGNYNLNKKGGEWRNFWEENNNE